MPAMTSSSWRARPTRLDTEMNRRSFLTLVNDPDVKRGIGIGALLTILRAVIAIING